MIRLNEQHNGLPTGICKKIDNENQLNEYTFYCVEVEITKINKKQQMPFIPHKINGILQYINELEKDENNNDIPMKIYLYSFDLQDLVLYHEIEYKFIQGVYWKNTDLNSGFGDTAQQLIFDRNEFKQKNQQSMQLLCKLMSNSLYGKTILKKSFETTSYIGKEKINEFCLKNYNLISKIENINEKQYRVILNTIEQNSYNYTHIGGFILAMSKRIMREVMNTANDNDITIYYQDTDSMHIGKKDITLLEQKYKEKFNRDLIGKETGQFHGDFSMSNAYNLISKKSIFIGKKIYIDYLEGIAINDGPDYQLAKNGPYLKCIKDEKIYGYHARWKGVNKIALLNARDEGESLMDVYERTINGEEIVFCLNPKNSPKFSYTNDGVFIRPDGDFIRTNIKK